MARRAFDTSFSFLHKRFPRRVHINREITTLEGFRAFSQYRNMVCSTPAAPFHLSSLICANFQLVALALEKELRQLQDPPCSFKPNLASAKGVWGCSVFWQHNRDVLHQQQYHCLLFHPLGYHYKQGSANPIWPICKVTCTLMFCHFMVYYVERY